MPYLTAIICPQCGQESFKQTGSVNRAKRIGAPVYCGRMCSADARRHPPKSDEVRRAEKAAYDKVRRNALGAELLAKKRAAYHAKVRADPIAAREAERIARKLRMPKHVEYCRSPEYRAWKKQYDRVYKARLNYGPFADAALCLLDLEEEINSRSTWLERQIAKGTLNKPIQRKREYAKRSIGETVRRQSEGCTVGHPEGNSERPVAARRR